MSNNYKHCIALIAFYALAALQNISAQTVTNSVNILFDFSDPQRNIPSVSQVEVVQIPTNVVVGGKIILQYFPSFTRANTPSLTNGLFTLTNVTKGVVYRVTETFRGGEHTDFVFADTNAADGATIGAWTNIVSPTNHTADGLFAYSQAQANQKFLAKIGDTGSNETFVGKLTLPAGAGVIGYVWTQTNADGSGDFEPATGGSGGAATNIYRSQVSGTGLVLATNLSTLVYTFQLNAALQGWAGFTSTAFSNGLYAVIQAYADPLGAAAAVQTYSTAVSNLWNNGSNNLNTAIGGVQTYSTSVSNKWYSGSNDLNTAISARTLESDFEARTNALATSAYGNASGLSSGTVASARLGSGGAGLGAKALFDDQTFKSIAGGGDMLAANNLNDVANKSTALSNLGGISTNYTAIWTNSGWYITSASGWTFQGANGVYVNSNAISGTAFVITTNRNTYWMSNNVVTVSNNAASGNITSIGTSKSLKLIYAGSYGDPNGNGDWHAGSQQIDGNLTSLGKIYLDGSGGLSDGPWVFDTTPGNNVLKLVSPADGDALIFGSDDSIQTGPNYFYSGAGQALSNLNASQLTSGTVPTPRLGSGTANSTTYLRGDQTWGTPSGGNFSTNSDGSFSLTGPGIVAGGFTNSALTANTLVKSDANKKLSSIANAVGAVTNDGSGGLGYDNTFSHTNQITPVSTTAVPATNQYAYFNGDNGKTNVGSTIDGRFWTNLVSWTHEGTTTNVAVAFNGTLQTFTVTNGPTLFVTTSGANGSASIRIKTNVALSLPPQIKWLAGSNSVCNNGVLSLTSFGGTNDLEAALKENQ